MKTYLKKKLFFLWRLHERIRGQFTTVHRRPIYAKSYFLTSDAVTDNVKIAIVLQGPLVRVNDFTLETVKLYKKIFPQTVVIISTWEDEGDEDVVMLKKEGAEVLLNKKPAYTGPYNLNSQIISARNGIQRAHEMGADYVIKSRTDHRMYAPNIGRFLINLSHTFPLVHHYPSQRQRLVTICYGGTFKYRLYNISDVFMFGCTEDMLLYWGVELVPQPSQPSIEPFTGGWGSSRPWDPHGTHLPPDLRRVYAEHWGSYLFTGFLKRIGRPLQNTLEDSWDTYAQHIVTVDHSSLDIYWFKPLRHLEYTRREYDTKDNRLVYFSEWLTMYCDRGRSVAQIHVN